MLVFLFIPTIVQAQSQVRDEKETIYAAIKEAQGERIEGYLHFYPEALPVSTKDNQKKSIPRKIIESIKLEKVFGGIPGAELPGGESYYSVHFQNNQDLFTLDKKYTFTLNTSLGLMTKTLDPEAANRSSGRSLTGQPFIRHESVGFSLEFKF
jgi:predicted amino acid dehydrogenase